MDLLNVRASLADVSHKNELVKRAPFVSTSTLNTTTHLMGIAAAGLACYYSPENTLTGAAIGAFSIPFFDKTENKMDQEEIRTNLISILIFMGATAGLCSISRAPLASGLLGACGAFGLYNTCAQALSPSEQSAKGAIR